MKARLWQLGLIICFVFLSSKAYLSTSFPYTHDGENHLARFANYAIAIKEGQIPPRWGPNLLNHYGYPVFNFNYPLANIISIPFSALKFNYETTFKIQVILAFAILGWATLRWMAKLNLSTPLSQIGVLVGLWAQPYLISVTTYRGSIGELWALVLAVGLMGSLTPRLKNRDQIFTSHWLEIGIWWTSLMLSHNVSALLGTALAISFVLVQLLWLKKNERIKYLKIVLIAFLLAIAYSLWFWLPALAEKSSIVIDAAQSLNQTRLHLVSLPQLLFSPLQFGYSVIGSVDTLGFSIPTYLILANLAIVVLIFKHRHHLSKFLLINLSFFCLVFICAFVLQLNQTAWVWQNINLLNYLQFPWRLSWLIAIASIPLVASFISHVVGKWKLVFWGLLLIFGWFAFQAKPLERFHKSKIEYDLFSQSTSTQHENMPRDFTYSEIASWQPGPSLLDGSAEVLVHKWSGSTHMYAVKAFSAVTLVEPTAWWLGWMTYVNGQQVSNHGLDATQGRIGFKLAEGSYEVKTVFTQFTWPRIMGNSVSLFSLLLTTIIVIKLCIHKPVQNEFKN